MMESKDKAVVAGLSFSIALEQIKLGKKLARDGWNGVDMEGPRTMYVYLKVAACNQTIDSVEKEEFGEFARTEKYIAIKTIRNKVLPWLASQEDMLADDWNVVE